MLINLKTYYTWWKIWKKAPVLSWIKASEHFKSGHYDIAHNLYKKGLVLNYKHPARHAARLDLAYCLFKMRRFEEAIEQLRQIISQSPENKFAYLRLAKIQMWIGHSLDAAWTMRRALQKVDLNAEMVALLILNAIDHEGNEYLLKEGLELVQKLSEEQKENLFLKTALVKYDLKHSANEINVAKLKSIATLKNAPFESIVIYAENLISQGLIIDAKNELKRAMQVASDHPRVLSLFAETYLKSGEFYNPDYARQLALSACQNSQWLSPRELHILAEAYFHIGDKISSLVLASKAKQAGSQLLGIYGNDKNLDKLIESLSSGTQA